MITYQHCVKTLRDLGLSDYSSVIVHYHPSMDQILGNTGTMIQALLDVCSEGNVFSYALIEDNQEPMRMEFNSVKEAQAVRKQLLDFDMKRYRDTYYNPLFMALTKSQGRLFSNHPYVVSCVNGKQSRYIMRRQPLDFPFGDESSFQAMFEMKSRILVFGDDFSQLQELRHAYTQTKQSTIRLEGCAAGGQWQHYLDYDFDVEDYKKAIEMSKYTKTLPFGNVRVHLIDYQEVSQCMLALVKQKFLVSQ